MHQDPGPDETRMQELTAAVEELVRYVRRSTTTGELSTAAAAVLSRLGREGPQRLTELARAEHVSQPSMTQLVTRMERDRLVARGAHRTDGRGVLVEITDNGRIVLSQRQTERSLALGQLVAKLSESERSAVLIALPALARAIHGP
ncbi:MarR family transcriptional regulator [Nocardia sp. BMG111209]|uniref:MarR family transcriptional regulator n=1 Tax=Nocardia sp. BMG111209 TaxID=1160137 RepID=UPI000365821A|nr:MarR family transcriptional regulator [Nocardia sp. BMG111209]